MTTSLYLSGMTGTGSSAFPSLQTERCLLRQVSLWDADALLKLRSDPEVMRFLDREPMTSISESEAMISSMEQSRENGSGISWGICLDPAGPVIGVAGVWRIVREHFRGEIGYTLLPEFWNRGLMTEVLRRIIRFAFDDMKLHSLEANVNPQNSSSIRLLEKLGFVREAYFRENFYFNGQFLDSAIYSLLDHQITDGLKDLQKSAPHTI